VDLLPINRFGIAQLSRERTGPDLFTRLHEPCRACDGTGYQQTAAAASTDLWQHLARELPDLAGESIELVCGYRLYAHLHENRNLIAAIEKSTNTRITLREDNKAKPLAFALHL
jgi:Ribonuclease G/E